MRKVLGKVGKALGYAWATPTVLISFVFLIGPAWAFRQIWYVGWYAGALEFAFKEGSYLDKKYGYRFEAICLGWTITYTRKGFQSNYCMMHERAHVAQQWVIGPFYLPCWFLFHFIFGYRFNPFETHAHEWGRYYERYNTPLFERDEEVITPSYSYSNYGNYGGYALVPVKSEPKAAPVLDPIVVSTVTETPRTGGDCPECGYPQDSHSFPFTDHDGKSYPAGAFVFIGGTGMVEHEVCMDWKKNEDAEESRLRSLIVHAIDEGGGT